MTQLQNGDRAPDLNINDLNGKSIDLCQYQGKKVLLTFFRFATCPFCTVRFAQLIQKADFYAEQGIQLIAVFESSADYIQTYVNRDIPFPVIPDPQSELYNRYGLSKSMMGLLLGMFRMPTMIRALFDRKYKMAKPDSSITRLPADFLIDPEQNIIEAYYGNDVGDHLSFRRLDRLIETDTRERLASYKL